MKISIIIPAYNEERLLPKTIQCIKESAAVFVNNNCQYEIIVCNNNSTDKTAEIASSLGATVVFEPVNQIARARNSGAKTASGDWLIFIDADSHPAPELFKSVLNAIESNKIIGGGCLIEMENIPFIAKAVSEFWNLISITMRWAAGSFIFCRSDAFKSIGGFNEDLFASEEIDFSKRIKRFARGKNLRFKIITKPRLRTSERKVHLYEKREYCIFVLKTVLKFGSTLRERESCKIWYDGRR